MGAGARLPLVLESLFLDPEKVVSGPQASVG